MTIPSQTATLKRMCNTSRGYVIHGAKIHIESGKFYSLWNLV